MRTQARNWRAAAVLVGAIYCALGIAASTIGAAAVPDRVSLLARWAAFLLSGAAFVAHVAHESLRLRSTTLRAAGHAALAAALGGFGLALSANLHDLASPAGYRPRMLIALVAWPLLTGVPAYVGALLFAALLGRARQGGGGRPPRPGN